MMYRAPSPIFDVHEFPPLRRVKPLPKRRRTSDPPQGGPAAVLGPLPMLDSPPTTESLIAQADALTAQMALSSYYMPVLGGVHDILKKGISHRTGTPVDLSGAGGQQHEEEEEDGGDGDYIDHLQQPGNTKKRKVPANMTGSAHGLDESNVSGGEDDLGERGAPAGGRLDREYDTGGAPPPGGPSGQRKGKLSRATKAGLQHKEMLKSRKRQLAAVLGALSHGDTLALDQALSANYPFVNSALGGESKMRIRLSRRRDARAARAFRAFRATMPPLEDARHQFPSSDFTVVHPSTTSDRLIATKDEVVVLHARFEAELVRQAAKAAEAAKQAAAAALNSGPLAKRADRSKQGRASQATDGKGTVADQTLPGNTKGRGKKKRSALANASNPHHLRNYVPSRLPNSQAAATLAVVNAQNLISPFPLRFLSAEIPPRRRKKSDRNVTPIPTLTNPADEWICPFCEYSLFYGDESGYQHAVRNRKKILRRRRRARERAAAAASGVTAVKGVDQTSSINDDIHPALEAPSSGDIVPTTGKQAAHKWKDERGEISGGGPPQQPALG